MVEQVLSLGWDELFPVHRLQPLALALYLALNVAFVLYYAWRYLKKGILSFDSYFIIFNLYVPIVFLFPFTFSYANAYAATGPFHEVYLDSLHTAFYICVLGILAFVLGGIFARVSKVRLPGYGLITKSLDVFWLSRVGLGVSVLVVLLLLVVMMGLGFEPGNARDTALRNPMLSPIYNLFHILAPFVAVNMLVRGYRKGSWFFYLAGALFAGLGLFGGTRAASVGVFIGFFFVLMITTRMRNFLVPLLALGGLLVTAVYIGGFRTGDYGLGQLARLPIVLLYGNNFSDLRDFAWVISGWDQGYLYGRTQLAGFLSFIPSSLSEFRATWGWGTFSTATAGLSVEGHAGLRPTIFGESFFNHGYAGVALSGFLTGFVIFKLTEYVHLGTRHLSPREGVVYVLGATTYFTLFKSFLITAGFFGFHILLALMVLGEIVFSAVANRHRALASAAS